MIASLLAERTGLVFCMTSEWSLSALIVVVFVVVVDVRIGSTGWRCT
jgi:hypothetical protein